MHYIIIKQGILFMSVLGVFKDKTKAIEHCNNAAKTDRDDYHDYYVHEFKLNTRYTDGSSLDGALIHETKNSKALADADLT